MHFLPGEWELEWDEREKEGRIRYAAPVHAWNVTWWRTIYGGR